MIVTQSSSFDKCGANHLIIPRADALHDIISWTGVELNGAAGGFLAVEDNVGKFLGVDFRLFQLTHHVGNNAGFIEMPNHELPWGISLLTVVQPVSDVPLFRISANNIHGIIGH